MIDDGFRVSKCGGGSELVHDEGLILDFRFARRQEGIGRLIRLFLVITEKIG